MAVYSWYWSNIGRVFRKLQAMAESEDEVNSEMAEEMSE